MHRPCRSDEKAGRVELRTIGNFHWVAELGGIRPATDFEMALFDLRLKRTLKHRHCVTVLPEVA